MIQQELGRFVKLESLGDAMWVMWGRVYFLILDYQTSAAN